MAFEKSYDDFHEHPGRIVRVRTSRAKEGEVIMQFSAGAGPLLHKNFEEAGDHMKQHGAERRGPTALGVGSPSPFQDLS